MFKKIWIICRVCLRQQEELYNLFDDIVHSNIWTMLRDCGGVPVREDDSFPDKICESCLKRLWKAMHFRTDCQRSHRDLLQKQMDANALFYEEMNNAEYLETSNMPVLKIDQEDEQISTYIKEDIENVLDKRNNDENFVDDGTNNNQNVKQYCIVTRNSEMEANARREEETESKQPIVLLLRLKNSPSESSEMKTSDDLNMNLNNTETSVTTLQIATNRKNVNEALKNVVEVNNDIIQLDNKEVKPVPEIPVVITSALKKAKWSCHICKKNYKTKELLRHHSYTHKKPHECTICHKTFSQRQSFLSHVNHHTGSKPYYCRFCCETFSDVCNRNNHEKRCHRREPLKCNSCNKSFRFLSHLQKHSSIHKLKKCLICNKDFTSVRIVRLHHRRQHLKLLDL